VSEQDLCIQCRKEIFKVLSGNTSQRLHLMYLQKEVPDHKIHGGLGHTMAEEVSLWPLTLQAWIQTEASSCKIYR